MKTLVGAADELELLRRALWALLKKRLDKC